MKTVTPVKVMADLMVFDEVGGSLLNPLFVGTCVGESA